MSVEDLIKRVKKASDLYEIIGVDREATSSEITKGYRKLALKLHPDKCSIEGGDEAFKKVSNAFSVLKDEEQRSRYDKYGVTDDSLGSHSPGGRGPGGFDPHDLFREMFPDHPAFRGGGGRQGMPGGIHFTTFGGGGPNVQQVKLPELPKGVQMVFSILARVIPPPLLLLGGIITFSYAAMAIVAFFLSRIHMFVFIYMVPAPANLKTMLFLGMVAAGLLGYI